MSRLFCLPRTIVLLIVLVLAGFAGAQQETQKAMQIWEKLIGRVEAWPDAELAKARAEIRKQLDALRKLEPQAEALILAGENAFRDAVEKGERAVKTYESSLADRHDPQQTFLHGENLLALGELYAVMGDAHRARERVLAGLQILSEARSWSFFDPAIRPVVQPINQVRQLLTVGRVLLQADRPHEAGPFVALAGKLCDQFSRRLSRPEDNAFLPQYLLVRAQLANATGQYHEGRSLSEQALVVFRHQTRFGALPVVRRELAEALHCLAVAQLELGQDAQAYSPLREAQDVLEDVFPQGHPNLGLVSIDLTRLYLRRGQEPDALEQAGKARTAFARLFPTEKYPRSHPALIQALTVLGDLLGQHGRHDEGRRLHEEAWEKAQAFYPGNHENKLAPLLGLVRDLQALGPAQLPRAQELGRQALARARALYPDGHLNLARCLVQMGRVQARAAQPADALALFQEAEGVYRQLFPRGHPDLSSLWQEVAAVRLQQGDRPATREAYVRALRSDRQSLLQVAETAADAEVLANARSRQASLHALLSLSRAPETWADAYAAVWSAKGEVMRLLRRRRAALRGGDQQRLEELLDTYNQISSLLRSPTEEPAVRKRILAELMAKADRLAGPPGQAPRPSGDTDSEQDTPAALARQLPAGSAFLDFVWYRDRLGSPEGAPRYAAFLLTPAGRPAWIDLGPASPIDQAVLQWRRAVIGWDPRQSPETHREWQQAADEQAKLLRRLVWEPLDLARRLPAQTRLLYLSPDGDLTLLPFAALPGTDAPLLLEEYTFAYVPHGPYLLDRLRTPRPVPETAGRFLAVGAVDYGPVAGGLAEEFAPLKGTAAELEAVSRLVPADNLVLLSGNRATGRALQDELPRARFAHLATHGFFRADQLAREHRLAEAFLRGGPVEGGRSGTGLGLGRRSPLSYTGLALAGANLPQRARNADGILAGASIAELPLEALYLVVASGCDTGRGQYTAGAGVQGLQWAFHLAGASNVVATLWPVNDRPTEVLMKLFYRQLLGRKVSSLEALHLAQRELYRHPELLPETERGPDGPVHVRLWGALVHSGTGH